MRHRPELRSRLALGAAVVLTLALPAVSRAAFEALDVDPRSRAMGGAFTGMDGGWLAGFHNPAANAWRQELEFGVTHMNPFGQDFTSLRSAGVSGKLPGKLGGVGFGFRRLATDFQDESLDEENTFSFSHGFQLHSDVSTTIAFGYALNLYSLSFGSSVNNVDPGSDHAFGLDLGARVTIRNRTSVGFIVRNLNNPTIGEADVEDLPRRVTGGVAYSPYTDVITTFDIDTELDKKPRFRGGAELNLLEWASIRTGIATDPGLFTAGVGIHWRGVRFDYGFSTGPGPLAESHQFGLSLTPAGLSGKEE